MAKYIALQADFRLAKKNSVGTNTLDYFGAST